MRQKDMEKSMENLHEIRQSLNWEETLISCVKAGQTQRLEEILSLAPKIYRSSRAYDELRFWKNWGIAMTMRVSRAVIHGGLNLQKGYEIFEVYTEKLELAQSDLAVQQYMKEMLIYTADLVNKAQSSKKEAGTFYLKCTQYITQNIFTVIRLDEMAGELSYSRPYLCSRFKKETGMTLTDYIQQSKIEEAQKLLLFSEYDLSEIANVLCFSSQSHFQTVFKKITGVTPMSWRRKRSV